MSGNTASFAVSGLGSVGVTSFSIGRQLGVSGGPTAGDLFSLTLNGITVSAGGGNATLNLTSGNLTVESFTSGSENDVYAAGSNLHVDATLGPVSASVDGVSFLYNPSAVTDWSFAGISGTVTAQTFQVSGNTATFSVSGLGSVGVTGFAIGRQLGVSGGPTAGDLFSLTLNGITVSAGGGNATVEPDQRQSDGGVVHERQRERRLRGRFESARGCDAGAGERVGGRRLVPLQPVGGY